MDTGKKQYLILLSLLVVTTAATLFAYYSLKGEWVLFRKAEGLFHSGDFSGAAVYYEGALASGLKTRQARINLGLAYVGTGDFVKAAAVFKDITVRTPEDRAARLYLARSLSWSGRYEEAVNEYRALLGENTAEGKPRDRRE